jgi:iron complex transport system substrate-binding protein
MMSPALFVTLSVLVGAPPAEAPLQAPGARRVVTLGGSATELVFALGLGAEVVGVDETSTYPAAIASLPKLGMYRAISAEGVLSARPTVVVAVDGTGPAAALEQLRAARVDVVVVPEVRTAAGLRQRIEHVARALGVERAGAKLAAEAEARFAAVAAEVAAQDAATKGARPRVLFVYARGGGAMNVAGRDTGAAEMIALAGGAPAIDGFAGYKPLTAEAVVGARPDVVLLTTHGAGSLGGVEALWGAPGLGLTPAGRARRVIVLDDALLLGFGPRTPDGVAALHRALVAAGKGAAR